MTTLPKLLATMNLFRESDGTVEITVSGHTHELMTEYSRVHNTDKTERPIDYIERLIIDAADRIRARKQP